MDVDIPYGTGKIKVYIPEPCKVLIPNKIEVDDENKIIEEALKNPIDMISFEEFVKNSESLLIIVNDASKPTPTPRILEHIHPYIKNHHDIKFLIATGTHKPPGEEECRFIFGRFYDIFKKHIYIHDSKKEENMKYYGRTSRGTEIYLNKMIEDAGNIIVVGSIEPHYFAGYTGGRKAILPGVSSYETIETNHKFALSEKACSLCLDDNPIHKDFNEAVKLLKGINIFSIQTVLTSDYKIYSTKCGDIFKSFDESTKYANEVYSVPVKKKGNIVISVVPYPMDINLYQSQHALENGRLVLEDNGVLILVSKCRMGVGNDAFVEILSKADSEQDIMELIGGKYKLGSHKSVKMLRIMSKNQIFAVTDLDDETIKKAKLKPYNEIQKAIDDAVYFVESKGEKPRVIVIPSGNLTVPLI